MRMQIILDSSVARPGSAPIWGGKKGEFRDWTSFFFVLYSVLYSDQSERAQGPIYILNRSKTLRSFENTR